MINYFAMPSVSTPITVKLNQKGLTKLGKQMQLKSRVSGSRTHIVLPSGLLVDVKTREEMKGPGEINKEKVQQAIANSRKKRMERERMEAVAAGWVEPEKKEKEKREYFVNEKVISGRIYAYVNAMKIPVLHMITISFPPCVTDDQGYKYLNQWLTVSKDDLHLREHLYISERQENGTVHFHIAVPQYFNIVKANRAMAIILRNEVRKGRLPGYTVHQAKRYNGVDIAKDRKTKKVTNFGDPKKRKNLIAYMTKYVTKGKKPMNGETKRGFTHLAWHNSRGFSSVFTAVNISVDEGKFLGLNHSVNGKRKVEREFFSWWPWLSAIPKIVTDMLRLVNQQILYNQGDRLRVKLFYGLQ